MAFIGGVFRGLTMRELYFRPCGAVKESSLAACLHKDNDLGYNPVGNGIRLGAVRDTVKIFACFTGRAAPVVAR